MKRYVPEKIDIDKLASDCRVNQIKGFHPDNMVWILSEITEKPTTSSGFVEIHSKRLQSFVHNYKDYLDPLDAIGIIECDKSFSYGLYSKTRGYRFTDEYSSTIKGVDINYLPIVKKDAKEKAKKLKTCRDNKHLVKWFNPSLTVDHDQAVSYLSVYYAEKKKEQELLAEKAQIIRNTWYEDYSLKCLELQ